MSARSSSPRAYDEPIRNQGPGTARTHPNANAYLLWRFFKQALRGITGVPTDASFLTTLFAIGVLASALRSVTAPLLRLLFRPWKPSFADTAMAGAVVREIPGSIGGVHARGKPFASTMIVVCLVAPMLQLLRLITAPACRAPAALAAFVKRYGV
jgi:hypothetical protein